MRIPEDWPRLVFICVPLLIASVDSGVLLREHLQTDTQRAIRLVKENNSRKENFTVQQYLYTTVYHRKSRGEPITIDGWRVSESDSSEFIVEFSYADSSGMHTACWAADIKSGRVAPRNETALDLSWH